MLKRFMVFGIFMSFFSTLSFAQGQIGLGDKTALKVGRYLMATDDFANSLDDIGGNFSATKHAISRSKVWGPKLMDKLENHRNKHQIQGPLNLFNIWHKTTLIHFYREAKGKPAKEVKQSLHALERIMTNIRLDIVQQYGLHIVL